MKRFSIVLVAVPAAALLLAPAAHAEPVCPPDSEAVYVTFPTGGRRLVACIPH